MSGVLRAGVVPPRLSLARIPTPLQRLQRFDSGTTARIWIKRDDLTGSVLSGNKVRKLEYALADAIEVYRADTVITIGALQSNHARATALLGAQLGLKVHLILRGAPDQEPTANHFLDLLAGAKVDIYPEAEYRARIRAIIDETVARYRAAGRTPYVIPAGASNNVGMWGYIDAAAELKRDCADAGFAPDAIILATGSGGTQAGLIVGCAMAGLGARVIGISVGGTAAHFEEKIGTDIKKWAAKYKAEGDTAHLVPVVLDRHAGPAYGVAERPVLETIRTVARAEGVVLDPVYTGKAFHGMLAELNGGCLAGTPNVVFIHCGGVFGLLAQSPMFRGLLDT